MKKITIIENDDSTISFEVIGFNQIEMLGILRFYEKNVWLQMSSQILKEKLNPISENKSQNENDIIKNCFFYENEKENIIRVNDIVEILPAENCVTNSDKIKYDERIDGMKCFVVNFNWNDKTIKVCDTSNMSNSFVVHPTWLKFISRKKS